MLFPTTHSPVQKILFSLSMKVSSTYYSWVSINNNLENILKMETVWKPIEWIVPAILKVQFCYTVS